MREVNVAIADDNERILDMLGEIIEQDQDLNLIGKAESCIPKCSACSRKCPANIGLPTDGSWKVEGDCFQCQKCIDTCPKKNIHCGVKKIRGNESWFTILRALILLGLCIWLGV